MEAKVGTKVGVLSMEEQWVSIKNFPLYSVSNTGKIRNDDRGRLVKTSHTQHGGVKVGLMSGTKQFVRSVKVLVAETFVDGRTERFDTPLHLDGDQNNNRADNIVWRPRWFCWKYHRQFDNIQKYEGVGPLEDRETGLVYEDVIHAALTHGLLFEEVYMSCVNKVLVFPTWQMFDWVTTDK